MGKKRSQYTKEYKIEVVRLRRENKCLRLEREILKNGFKKCQKVFECAVSSLKS